MAPELVAGTAADKRSDLHSFGATVYRNGRRFGGAAASGRGLPEIDWLPVWLPADTGANICPILRATSGVIQQLSLVEHHAPAARFREGAIARRAVNMALSLMAKNSFCLLSAPRAGLEPAAYCLGGKPEPGQATPTAARRVALTCDDNRLTPPDTAWLLPTLAPNLAPWQIVSSAKQPPQPRRFSTPASQSYLPSLTNAPSLRRAERERGEKPGREGGDP